ncbi:MAG: hypothetical protein AAFR17_05285 [Pseudomonadota bacterium]
MRWLWQTLARIAAWISPVAWCDAWLLKNAPVVWRTRVLHVLWYTALLYGLLRVLGLRLDFTVETIWDADELNNLVLAILALSALVGLVWYGRLRRTPMGDLKLRPVIVTLLLYTICTYPLLTLPHAITQPLAETYARLSDRETINDLIVEINRPVFFLICEQPGVEPEGLLARKDSLQRVGFDLREYRSSREICPSGTPFSIVTPDRDRDFDGVELRSHVMVLNDAMNRQDGLDGGSFMSLFSANRLFLSVLIAAVILSLSSRVTLGAPTRGIDPLRDLHTWFEGRFPELAHANIRLNRALIRDRPWLWSLRLEVALPYATAFVVAAMLLPEFIEWLVDQPMAERLAGLIGEFWMGLSIFLAVSAAFFAAFLAIARLQRQRMPVLTSRRDHVAAICCFFLPSLPAILLIAGFLETDAGDIAGLAFGLQVVFYWFSVVSYLCLLMPFGVAFRRLLLFAIGVIAAGLGNAALVMALPSRLQDPLIFGPFALYLICYLVMLRYWWWPTRKFRARFVEILASHMMFCAVLMPVILGVSLLYVLLPSGVSRAVEEILSLVWALLAFLFILFVANIPAYDLLRRAHAQPPRAG